MGAGRFFGAWVIVVMLTAATFSRAAAIDNNRCLACHGQPELPHVPAENRRLMILPSTKPAEDAGARAGLYVQKEMLASSAHANLSCTDCHTDAASLPHRQELEEVSCYRACHNTPRPGSTSGRTLYDTYRTSVHGQLTSLGMTRAASCVDCHGGHDVSSQLRGENLVQTCRKCHPGAGERFVMFDPHADHRDAGRYPLLHGIWLYFAIVMSVTFGFFGLHSVLWLVRGTVERSRHGASPAHSGAAIKRFTRIDRITHAMLMVSIFGLTLTGLPLLFADENWSRLLAHYLGGPVRAGVIHRGFAVLLMTCVVTHLYVIASRCCKHGVAQTLFGPATLLPRWKDATDCLAMWRWFFTGGAKPQFGRWTYWEKFDYLAAVAGTVIVMVSGLLLWFAEFFAGFCPGWIFNIAALVHGYEALLAIGFIFTIHFFNAHLRPEKFPVDDVMFSGSLSEEEFKQERGVEYARLAAKGELDALCVLPPRRWHRAFAVIVGMLAMTIGVTLVVLIILVGLGWR